MHAELLRQALQLATMDPKRPKQANLRRAIASAYYGVFHFLVEAACRSFLGSQHVQRPYRNVLGRAFEHATMRDACVAFAGGTLKASAAKGLPPSFSVPPPIQGIAQAFVVAQELRHAADYDRSEHFARSDAVTLVEQLEAAIEQFESLAASVEKSFFLACLLTWKSLAKR